MTTAEDPEPSSVEPAPRERPWHRSRTDDRDETSGERPRVSSGPSRVLVPFDGTSLACDALESAFRLFPDAAVTALLVVDDSTILAIPNPAETPPAERTGTLRGSVPRELERALAIAERRDEPVRTAGRVGAPVPEILEYVKRESVDHVVIGSECRSGLARVLRGSVAEVVVRHSTVPVTVIPASNRGD